MISSINFGTNPVKPNQGVVRKPDEPVIGQKTSGGDEFVSTTKVAENSEPQIQLRPIILKECGETTGSNA